jgi:hypothetical protein
MSRSRNVSHFQRIMDALLQADLGIDKFSSYIVLRVPFVKHESPLDRRFGEGPAPSTDPAEQSSS